MYAFFILYEELSGTWTRTHNPVGLADLEPQGLLNEALKLQVGIKTLVLISQDLSQIDATQNILANLARVG